MPPRLVLRLVPPSRPASRLVSCRPVAPSYHFVGRGGLAWRPFRLVLLYSPRSCVVLILYRAAVPPRPSRLAMRRNGAVLRFASRVVVGRFLTRYARLVSSCLVGGSVSWREACRENELTKTAHLPSLSLFVSSGSCPSCRGDMRIEPGRTVVRQGVVAGLFERPACRICPQVVSAKQSSRSLLPRPGGGGLFEACG